VSPHTVIDVGSNIIHLLIGEVEDDAVLPVTGEKISARLGAGVDETGKAGNPSTTRLCSSKSPFKHTNPIKAFMENRLTEYKEAKSEAQPSKARRSSGRGESPDMKRLSGSSRS
jgi:hypothetical protein